MDRVVENVLMSADATAISGGRKLPPSLFIRELSISKQINKKKKMNVQDYIFFFIWEVNFLIVVPLGSHRRWLTATCTESVLSFLFGRGLWGRLASPTN